MIADLVQDLLAQPTRGSKVLILGMEKGTPDKENYVSKIEELIENHERCLAETGLAHDGYSGLDGENYLGEYSGIDENTNRDNKNMNAAICTTAPDDSNDRNAKKQEKRSPRSISHFLYTVHELRDGEVAGTGSNHFQAQVAAEQFFPKELHNSVIFTKLDANMRLSRNLLAEIESCYSTLSEQERLGATYVPGVYWTAPEADANRTIAEFTISNMMGLGGCGIVDFQMAFVSGSLKGVVKAGYTCASLLPEDENLYTRKLCTIPHEDVKTYRCNALVLKLFFPLYVDKKSAAEKKSSSADKKSVQDKKSADKKTDTSTSTTQCTAIDLEAGPDESSDDNEPLLRKEEKEQEKKEHITDLPFMTKVFLPKIERWQLGNCENFAFLLEWLTFGPQKSMASMTGNSNSDPNSALQNPSLSQKLNVFTYCIDNTLRYYMTFSVLQIIAMPIAVITMLCSSKGDGLLSIVPTWIQQFVLGIQKSESVSHSPGWDKFVLVTNLVTMIFGNLTLILFVVALMKFRSMKRKCFPTKRDLVAWADEKIGAISCDKKNYDKKNPNSESLTHDRCLHNNESGTNRNRNDNNSEESDIENHLTAFEKEENRITLQKLREKIINSHWDIGLDFDNRYLLLAFVVGPLILGIPVMIGFYLIYALLRKGITNERSVHKAVQI